MKRWITRVVLAVLIAGGVLLFLDQQHRFDFHTETFTFDSGGNELAATIHLPPGDGPHGIIVFVPGDGDAETDPAISPVWEALADAGYATVHWTSPASARRPETGLTRPCRPGRRSRRRAHIARHAGTTSTSMTSE